MVGVTPSLTSNNWIISSEKISGCLFLENAPQQQTSPFLNEVLKIEPFLAGAVQPPERTRRTAVRKVL